MFAALARFPAAVMELERLSNAEDPNELVDLIAASLAPGQPDIVRKLFNSAGARAPEIIWAPSDKELHNPLLENFATICRGYANEDGTVPAESIRLEDFGGLTEWLLLLDVIDSGRDFRYTFYGQSVAEHFGTDMTGRLSSEFSGYIGTFFTGLYRAALQRGEIVYSEHEPPTHIFVRVWQRLIVPLCDENGVPTRILVLNVPDNELRVGLELMVDPVMVLAADETIVYSNRAAQSLFSIPAERKGADKFTDVTNIELDVGQSPSEMLRQHRVDDSVQLTIRDAIVERLVMTVSATHHRGTAFYVVVMRMIGN